MKTRVLRKSGRPAETDQERAWRMACIALAMYPKTSRCTLAELRGIFVAGYRACVEDLVVDPPRARRRR